MCAAYGWTVDYTLNMPARQFFLMLQESRRLHAFKMSQLCDIAAIPMCEPKYYSKLKDMFLRLLLDFQQTPESDTIAVQSPVNVVSHEDASRVFMRFFASKRGAVH